MLLVNFTAKYTLSATQEKQNVQGKERYNSGGLSMSITEAERVMWDDIVLFSHSMVVCLESKERP